MLDLTLPPTDTDSAKSARVDAPAGADCLRAEPVV